MTEFWKVNKRNVYINNIYWYVVCLQISKLPRAVCVYLYKQFHTTVTVTHNTEASNRNDKNKQIHNHNYLYLHTLC